MEDILAIILIFGSGGAFLLAISPVGKAIAERIRGGVSNAPDEVVERLNVVIDEVEQVRGDLMEVQERLDFVERVLTRGREANRLPKPDAAGESEGAWP